MQHSTSATPGAAPADELDRQRKSATDDGADPSAQAALSAHGPLEMSDEDRGNDPYNRTGRFRRTVR